MNALIIIAQIIGVLLGGVALVNGFILSVLGGGNEISDVTAGMAELGCISLIGGALLAGFSIYGLVA